MPEAIDREAFRPLRLALEPNYDGGRVGSWLVELPGAFGWASDREAAVSQSPSVAGWWREWLARHGEAWPLGWIGSPAVEEEVATDDTGGYLRLATFTSDLAPLDGRTLEASLHRLDWARRDLADLLDRLAAVDAAEGERTADEVLRHIAGVEAWLGSRLDPSARYPGSLEEPDPAALLGATRAWAIDNLRRQHTAGPVAERTDSKGERWTVAKVVRRYVYHSVDHLRELDRRLARAERRTERLTWSRDRLDDDVAPLVRLLRSVGWDRRTRDPDRLAVAIRESQAMIGAWDGDELVGFARELGDRVFHATISMVVVDPRWQGLGLADRLVEPLMADRPTVRFTLGAAGGLASYYRRFGFEPDPSAMVRPRQEPGTSL
jgi:GNAT superfamily N-acetyltransferase